MIRKRIKHPLAEHPQSAQAALGFRVKSGWAAAVLLAGPVRSPQLLDRRRLELRDPDVPESTPPYHAGMGTLQTDATKIERLRNIISDAASRAFAELLQEYRTAGHDVGMASLVVGSEIDPAKITNPHIRAHALEGRLFRTVLEDAARACHLPSSVIAERNLLERAVKVLKQSETDLKSAVTKLGRALGGPWRADDKAACLAAWMALAQ
jgi:hypothetical protein